MKLPSVLSVLVLAGCATQFTGDPKVPNGPHGCMSICQSWGMQLVGMIQMGEYSDGCICQVPAAAPGTAVGSIAAAGPAVTGVVMQARRNAANAAR